jgi:hypothetical protein
LVTLSAQIQEVFVVAFLQQKVKISMEGKLGEIA